MGDEMEQTNWEKYVAGEPLTDDLKAMREGRIIEEEDRQGIPPVIQTEMSDWEINKPLTRADRADLREFRDSRGWTLFIRIQKRLLQLHERSAISKSKQSPLLNRDEVAAEWANVSMFERALMEQKALVDAEVQELERDETQ